MLVIFLVFALVDQANAGDNKILDKAKEVAKDVGKKMSSVKDSVQGKFVFIYIFFLKLFGPISYVMKPVCAL